MQLHTELRNIIKGDVENTGEILTKYSHDASLLEVRPQVVVFPKDAKDVCAIVKWVAENKKAFPELSITARAAGTCMSGGAIGESIIMDFTRYMNEIKKVEHVTPSQMIPLYPGSHPVTITGTATVLPGCYYRDFETTTLKENLLLPCYTASKSINAVGGMVGNNSAGEKTLNYGKTEDYIKSLKVVLSDGREYTVQALTKKELYAKIAQKDFEGDLYRDLYQLISTNLQTIKDAKPQVSKNSAGYYLWNVWNEETEIFDLPKLIVGSQGTLGIVTEITFHLVDVKPANKLVVVFMKDISKLGELVTKILPSHPESIESYDDATMKLAVKFFPDFLKNKGLLGMLKFMWSFWPEVFMMVKGFPKLVLLVEFAGENEKVVKEQARKLVKEIKPFGFPVRITKSKNDADKYWDIRRESFALLRKHVKDKHTAPFIDDIIVPPQTLPEFLPKLNTLLDAYPITYTIAGHAGNGNFHIIPLMDFKDPKTAEIIMELSTKVYDLVLEYKGSTNGEHNDGIIRTPFLKQMYGEQVYELFTKTKQIFDPTNFLNPGKKVALTTPNGIGTKEYIASHIIQEEQ